MTLLVVGNHQQLDLMRIEWTRFDEGVLFAHTVQGGTFETKHQLRVHTTVAKIPLFIQFVVPPVENHDPPVELLRGLGKIYSDVVIVYGECGTFRDDHKNQGVLKEDRPGLPEST